ncbi:hypothetical protein BGW38_005795, partial [Lunasporangiospora selenospora]
KEQVAEVTFDTEARKEYLTGFHKRKVHRQTVAREAAKKKEYEEKLEARKEARAARKEMQEEKLKQYADYRRQLKLKNGEPLSEDEEEDEETVFSDDEEEKASKEPKQAQFKTKTQLTTVTVIEDMDQEEGLFVDKQLAKVGSSSATTDKGARKIKAAKEKKKKFRKWLDSISVFCDLGHLFLVVYDTYYGYYLVESINLGYEGKAQRKVNAYNDKKRGRGSGREERGRGGGREERGKKGKGGRGGRGGGRR